MELKWQWTVITLRSKASPWRSSSTPRRYPLLLMSLFKLLMSSNVPDLNLTPSLPPKAHGSLHTCSVSPLTVPSAFPPPRPPSLSLATYLPALTRPQIRIKAASFHQLLCSPALFIKISCLQICSPWAFTYICCFGWTIPVRQPRCRFPQPH